MDPPEADTEVEAAISTIGTDPLIAELRKAAGDSYCEIHQAIRSGIQAKNLPPLHPGQQLIDLWNELAASDDVLMTYRGSIVVPGGVQREKGERVKKPLIFHRQNSFINISRSFTHSPFSLFTPPGESMSEDPGEITRVPLR